MSQNFDQVCHALTSKLDSVKELMDVLKNGKLASQEPRVTWSRLSADTCTTANLESSSDGRGSKCKGSQVDRGQKGNL